MVIPIFCKFQHHSVQFFQNGELKCLKTEIYPAPHPLTVSAYPTPGKVVPPIYFMKMTTKDVKEINYMLLVTFFSVLERPGKNREGVCNKPPPPLG